MQLRVPARPQEARCASALGFFTTDWQASQQKDTMVGGGGRAQEVEVDVGQAMGKSAMVTSALGPSNHVKVDPQCFMFRHKNKQNKS